MSNYFTLPTRARKDVLGVDFYDRLIGNSDDLQRMVLRGHNADGSHNDREVARAVGTIVNTAGVASISGASSIITSVTGFTSGGTTGVALVTLNSAFVSDPLCVDVSVQDTATESLPIIHTIEQASANTVRVRLYKLAALSGNTWNAVDATFAISVYANKYADPATQLAAIADAGYGDGFRYDKWSQFVANQATQQTNALSGHASAGTHAVREVARAWGQVHWNGTSYAYKQDTTPADLRSSTTDGTLTRTSAGIVKVGLGAGFTTPMQVFAYEGYDASADPSFWNVINWPTTQMATTYVTAYIYRYDPAANNWSRGDCDFSLTVHTA